ncbi:DNA-directed RNA polymerase subunit RPC12/RpoP [Clostridium acetobutylicum]|uniref:Zn-finger containing protein n=1 Tax=Clostridium acetobutylicum (strain ATCC 824 / DSM 792 / JCM 1419 / IAM 19013 / LMG 5710 / NBRC 13948 / NRRL B-527 / VKM B-1787 / 2291 / W) TaxID=272562 RepID=Q97HU4_CLOAB|nr:MULTISPECIES: Zn-finger containing protein [Clostridium]AAK79876.1 Zn-finger containing protein [Clostridium acetobutylicum ATCC 824]ADZ20965.1 Zn-finger containing protein [Clostridium acetobutylicum EA 2018]AEI32053.1 Zn-finger containing protein [Clostridium acetobutylicum DSM 1731]AWV79693.1 hypothetical protein DK921_06180 [Clostridium acetobutylicum]MBC2394331.1 hypothetical protein [Clostridium acetobutylicum]
MQSIYTSYKCSTCSKEFVLLTEDVESIQKDRYIACPYCSSKRLVKGKVTDDLRECMKARVYKRVKGALKEIK